VQFAVWAPRPKTVAVEIEGVVIPLDRDDDGVWSGFVPGVGAGTRYLYRLNDDWSYPDPYSRSQPDGPHGPSEVVDPQAHAWRDNGWPGLRMEGLVIYECHVGIQTREGTFDALVGDLDALKNLGVNAIELMPVAEFPGQRNWGYDGVDPFAPSHIYGGPAALKRLVDAAHERGIGVILDVVYNHFGPDGNYLGQYSDDYLTDRHHTPWGEAVNFDAPNSEWVRRYVIDNALYWLREYHMDGLRLDAAFSFRDDSPSHILRDLAIAARAAADRSIVLIAETYENDARYVTPVEAGGYGFDAVWADDFHHAVHAAASHEHSGYYVDYAGTTDELARTINRGWLYEGEHSRHFNAQRGTSSEGLPAHAFVYCVQNHDQVGNRAFGRRFAHLTGIEAKKPWSALLLLLPYTPMIFAGEEFAASSRFHYFTDHHGELGRAVTEGRRAEAMQMAQFSKHIELQDPQAEETFLESKLDLSERQRGGGEAMMNMYRALLTLRREDPVLKRQDRRQMQAIAASEQLLIVRMWDGPEERLVVCNIGLAIDAVPSAAGVPPELRHGEWRVLLSTNERRFGGTDDRVRFDADLIAMPPHTAVLLASKRTRARGRIFSALRSAGARLPRSRRTVTAVF
jgi:maltooligosyltrehalose trehalohydrolase